MNETNFDKETVTSIVFLFFSFLFLSFYSRSIYLPYHYFDLLYLSLIACIFTWVLTYDCIYWHLSHLLSFCLHHSLSIYYYTFFYFYLYLIFNSLNTLISSYIPSPLCISLYLSICVVLHIICSFYLLSSLCVCNHFLSLSKFLNHYCLAFISLQNYLYLYAYLPLRLSAYLPISQPSSVGMLFCTHTRR